MNSSICVINCKCKTYMNHGKHKCLRNWSRTLHHLRDWIPIGEEIIDQDLGKRRVMKARDEGA